MTRAVGGVIGPGADASLFDLMRASAPGPVLTRVAIGTNLLVFVLMLFAGAGWWHTSTGVQLAWGANFGPATQDGQWWRVFTAMFIHFGVLHLVMNMWALWDVGRLVERLYGRWRYALIFLGSGVAGNVVSLVLQGNQAVSGGASGAVFSLYGALLVFLWRERRQVDRGEFRWLFGGALVFSLLILCMGLVVPGIDNAAHAGGLLAGALLGRVLARPWAADSPPAGAGRWLAGVFLAGGVALLMVRLPQPSYLLGEEQQTRDAIAQYLSADHRLGQQWEMALRAGAQHGLSFDQVASRLSPQVAQSYEYSFEHLMGTNPASAVPSAALLAQVQAYATVRQQATRELAEGMRQHDAQKVRKALAQIREAPKPGLPASAPASAGAKSN